MTGEKKGKVLLVRDVGDPRLSRLAIRKGFGVRSASPSTPSLFVELLLSALLIAAIVSLVHQRWPEPGCEQIFDILGCSP